MGMKVLLTGKLQGGMMESMERFTLSETIKSFASVFKEAGFDLYLVGGCVRDHLMRVPCDDYDFCTSAEPEEVIHLFRRVIPTGIDHGTVTVLFKGEKFEVTTFRTESAYSDMRHPDNVTFVRSLSEDLKRRDFTINAFAADCTSGEIIDLHHGKEDLKAHIIRAIGEPRERFQEDALRILRALRFAAKLNFTIEEKTFSAMQELRENLRFVSKERIHEEILKMVMSDHPKEGFTLMEESGVMEVLFPELQEGASVMQNGMHHDTVLAHNINCCQAAADHHYPLVVRLAALFHDVGKSRTVVYREEANTYHGHDHMGADMTRDILRNLKASNEEIESVSHLIDEHMFCYSDNWSDAAVRRFINRVGKGNIDDLFRLRFADEEATSGKADYETIRALDERIKQIEKHNDALSLKELKVNGNDMMALGAKGKDIGDLLSYLLERVIDDPTDNERERLLSLARERQSALCSSNFPTPRLS